MKGVPISLILNANPTFVRGEDPPGIAALAADIRQFGLQQKILLDPDYQIIDGARRVLACHLLGMTEIPAVSTKDWPTIRDHIIATRKVEESLGIAPLPYNWAQLSDWYTRVLKPLALPYERFRANQARKTGAGRARERIAGQSGRSQTLADVSEMTGLQPDRLAKIFRVKSTLDKVKREAPELHEESVAYAAQAERSGEAVTRVTIQLLKSLEARQVGPNTADRKVAEAQVLMISKAAAILSTVVKELDFLLNSAITEDEAKQLFKLIHPPTRRLHVLRRKLGAIGKMRLSGSSNYKAT